MENNQIYSSVDDSQMDGTIFVVDIEENETSMRLKLKGEYSLRIWDDGLSLLSLNTERALYYWPFTVLRRYGTSKSGFTFEAGRKSHAGPGVLRFSSPSGKLITQTVKETVNKIKGYNCTPNTELALSPSINSNCQLGEEITGDYTNYSKTTDRPKRKVKPQEPHIELSLEIPGQYISNRLAAGHSLSNPVSHGPPNESSEPPVTYYNENFNRPVGPSIDYNDYQSLTQTASLEYNCIGDATGLIDNYSLLSPQDSSSLSIISNAPIPLARTKSPSIPDPYKIINRALPHQDTFTSSADQFIKSEESIMSATSTFPTCVSPLPKAHSSAEDSSSEDEITKKPAIRKISQAQTTRTELTTDLELKAVDRSSPDSENYVNIRRDQLMKTLSNPGEIGSKDEFKLVGTEHHNYMNISRQQTTVPRSDYCNVTPDMLPEEKRRSNTDTNQRKNSQQPHFNFSPSYNNRGDILEGPSSFSNMQDILSEVPESEDILYGNFQMHPSSHPDNSQQLYVNTQGNSKPTVKRLEDLNKSGSVESNYTFQSDISITTNYTLPIASQEPPSNPRLNYDPIGVKTAQPGMPKQNPRPYSNRKIPSEYSYLTEVLKQAPSRPRAYNLCRGLPTENK